MAKDWPPPGDIPGTIDALLTPELFSISSAFTASLVRRYLVARADFDARRSQLLVALAEYRAAREALCGKLAAVDAELQADQKHFAYTEELGDALNTAMKLAPSPKDD